MNKLEDAPKELQDMFAELFKEHLSDREYPCAYKEAYAHFFLKGFDVAMAAGGMKPKRKIVQLVKTDQGWFSLSNTGEWFYLKRPLDSDCHWIKYPDLPQD